MSSSLPTNQPTLTPTPKFFKQTQSFLYDNPIIQTNPSVQRSQWNIQTGVFVTNCIQLQSIPQNQQYKKRTTGSPKKKSILPTLADIKTKEDLQKIRRIYKCELLQRKSKSQLSYQNLQLMKKINQSPHQVDSWNNVYTNRNKNQQQQQQQERIPYQIIKKNQQIFKKIRQASHKVLTWNFKEKIQSIKKFQRIAKEKQIQEDNRKIMLRVAELDSKVDCWCIKNPELLEQHNKIRQQMENQQKQKVQQQNYEFLQRMCTTPTKISTRIDITTLRAMAQHQRMCARNQHLQQMKKLIDEGEKKLRSQDQEKQLLKKRNRNRNRLKSLPSRFIKKIYKQNEEKEKSLKLIQNDNDRKNSKSDINYSPESLPRNSTKLKINQKIHSNNSNYNHGETLGIKIKQLQQTQKNTQIKYKIQNNLTAQRIRNAKEKLSIS